MLHFRSGAHRRALSTCAAIAVATLLAAGCTQPPPDQSGAKITVQATQPSGTVSPGDDIQIHLTITNASGGAVSSMSIETRLDPHVRLKTQTCSALGIPAGVQETQPCNTFIYPASIPAGQSVTIDYVGTVTDGAQGSISSSFVVALLRGPAAATATSTATIADTRGGAYTAWTSDGRQADLAADFASHTLSFSNADGAFGGAFQTSYADPAYHFDAAHTGFMQHAGWIAGNVAIAGVPRVFVAARTLVTRLADLDGRSFNVFSIDTAADGTSTSRFATAQLAGSTLAFCTEPAPHAVDGCPPASQHAYAVSASGNGFTAVDGVSGDTIHFQVTQVGVTLVLLRAEPAGAGRTFSIGLAHDGDFVDTAYWGGDTAGHWNTLELYPAALVELRPQDDGSIASTHGSLFAIDGTSLASSILDTDPTPVWISQEGNLAVVMGQPGSTHDGLLQVFTN